MSRALSCLMKDAELAMLKTSLTHVVYEMNGMRKTEKRKRSWLPVSFFFFKVLQQKELKRRSRLKTDHC